MAKLATKCARKRVARPEFTALGQGNNAALKAIRSFVHENRTEVHRLDVGGRRVELCRLRYSRFVHGNGLGKADTVVVLTINYAD